MDPRTDGLGYRFAAPGRGELGEMADLECACYEEYREFAPAAWQPPGHEQELEMLRRWHGLAGFWALLARAADPPGGPEQPLAGHITFIPASLHRRLPVQDEALAHIGQLFVAREHRGSGLAGELLGRARAAAREQGFQRMRLYVVEAQRRARRFYEREGFACAAQAGDIGLGLTSLEYRLTL